MRDIEKASVSFGSAGLKNRIVGFVYSNRIASRYAEPSLRGLKEKRYCGAYHNSRTEADEEAE